MWKIIANMLLSMIAGKLKDFIIKVIQNLDYETITNKEKREKAFQEIKDQAKVEGKTLRDSLINLAIELAVSLVKK